MILLFTTGTETPIDRERDNSAGYIRAIRGLRVARAKLGDETGYLLKNAKGDIDRLIDHARADHVDRLLIGQTEDKIIAWQAIRAAQADDLRVQVEGDMTPEEAFSEEPPQSDEPDDAEFPEETEAVTEALDGEGGEGSQDAGDMPHYAATLIAHCMLAAVDGVAGNAVVLANTIRQVMERELPEDAWLWDDVMQSLFDAFPVNTPESAASMPALAAEFGR
jgi:hypothetical protein